MEVKINIPDGDYCENCRFVNYYFRPLVNIMGDKTGFYDSGCECFLYKTKLEVENHGCFNKIKKCMFCKLSEKESLGLFYLLLCALTKSDEEKDKESKGLNDA